MGNLLGVVAPDLRSQCQLAIKQVLYAVFRDVKPVPPLNIPPQAREVSSKQDIIGDLVEQAHLTNDVPSRGIPIESNQVVLRPPPPWQLAGKDRFVCFPDEGIIRGLYLTNEGPYNTKIWTISEV